MSEEEFDCLNVKRVEFLKRVGYFDKLRVKERRVGKGRAVAGGVEEDFKTGRDRYKLCYEPTNISATRDSLYWSWRRVWEYWRDFSDEEDGKRKEVVRIDPGLRKR
ncbi:MAG: hypothetical protein JSW38_11400 [Dehalococcoidia bacterium]|nr:MAG: hypothetical protein JSW38_11400 [Dehalococcoidia bacterium]